MRKSISAALAALAIIAGVLFTAPSAQASSQWSPWQKCVFDGGLIQNYTWVSFQLTYPTGGSIAGDSAVTDVKFGNGATEGIVHEDWYQSKNGNQQGTRPSRDWSGTGVTSGSTGFQGHPYMTPGSRRATVWLKRNWLTTGILNCSSSVVW